jgi:alginate O-acetyltransferase complex protein AlgI
LWHGAAWTFVVWGLIHGLCLVLERVLRAIFKNAAWTDTLGVQILLGLATYAAVCFSWVFFRAGDFTTAARLVRAMVGWFPNGDAILTTREILQVAGVTLALLVAHWSLRNITIEKAVARLPHWLVTAVWALMLGAIILTQGNGSAFIYFQF